VALLDALAAERLVAEIDHRTAPEDVGFAISKLRARKRRSLAWLDDVDEGTDVETVLGWIAHRENLALAILEVGSDAFPVVVLASPRTKVPGVRPVKPVAYVAPDDDEDDGEDDEAALISEEDEEPWTTRYVAKGVEKGDPIYGVYYTEPCPAAENYRFFHELHETVGKRDGRNDTRAGLKSRAHAIATAHAELADRIAQGWIRISRTRRLALQKKR
jgi:hypothetical protein